MKASSYNLFAPNPDALHGELVARILAPDDWNFVSRQTSPSIQQMFCRERSMIAVSWLRRMRSQVEQLMKHDRQSVSPNRSLSLMAELKRMGYSAIFYTAYGAAHFVIRVSGPVQAAGLMGNLVAMSERLWSLHKASLANIEPSHIDQSGTPAAGSAQWPPARQAQDPLSNMEVEAAIVEIKKRDLAGLRSEFSGLTYLASTRDYNSARYYHEGLSRRFTEDVMEQALAACHAEAFRRLVRCSLEETVRQLDIYVRAAPESRVKVLYAWTRLEPFRVLMPLDCDQISADLFVSNVRVVLGILQDQPLVAGPVFDIADLPIKP